MPRKGVKDWALIAATPSTQVPVAQESHRFVVVFESSWQSCRARQPVRLRSEHERECVVDGVEVGFWVGCSGSGEGCIMGLH